MACPKFLQFNNGIKMPAIGLGTWQAPKKEVDVALDLALECGYRHIDTAPVYLNEEVIGDVLKKWIDLNKVKRNELFIVTKLPPTGNRASCVEKCLRKSLKDLQLSFVDLYLIHTPFSVPETSGEFLKDENGFAILDKETDHIATWKKMEEMVELGLTRSIGLSNFNKRQIERIMQNSTIKPANLQVELHVYFQQNELFEYCKQNDIVLTAYAPLGSKGVVNLNKLAGVERTIPDLMSNPQVIKIAKNHNKTAAQVLIRWILERGIATIPKSTNPIRLKENLNVFDFSLSADEMKILSSLDTNYRTLDFSFFKGLDKHPEFPW